MLSSYRILLFTFFLISSLSSFCQQKKVELDTSNVVYRHPSADVMDAYKQMDEYQYDRFEAPQSIWDKISKWFFSLFKDVGIHPIVIKYSLISIGVLILIFIVLKLIGIKPSGLFIFKHDSSVTPLNFKQSEDDIYNQDLDELLNLSIRNNAYREAIRILYLICLRHLDQSNNIDWKPWKTNHDYYYELKDKKRINDFKQLVTNYEYVWYGHFSVDNSIFTDIKDQFENFMSLQNNN